MNLEFSRQILRKIPRIPNFMKIFPVAAGVLPRGRTDWHDEANSRFSQFCERAWRAAPRQFDTKHRYFRAWFKPNVSKSNGNVNFHFQQLFVISPFSRQFPLYSMWLQHVQRMDTNRLQKQALQYKPKGRRNIGQPRKRWTDQLHLEDQGTENTPNPSGTWWWWSPQILLRIRNVWDKSCKEIFVINQLKAQILVSQ